VIKYATIWKQLGKNLKINENLLNIIEKDNPFSCENCCSKMLSEWLDLIPEASWGMLLDAVKKLQDKLSTTAGHAVDKLPDTVENLCIAANKLPDTVEKLDTTVDKLPDAVEKLETMADKLPDTVEKLDSAVDKLPKAVDQLWEVVDNLPKTVGKMYIADTNLDNLAGNYGNLQINFISYVCVYIHCA